jgi:hypothetical protein
METKISAKKIPTKIDPAANPTLNTTDTFESTPNSSSLRIVDTFESRPARDFFGFDQSRQLHSVTELRKLIAAAKAERKTPFSDTNLNRLLAKNHKSYREICGDLKNWVNNNFYLTSRQKAEFDRMPESNVKQIQISGHIATKMAKLIQVEIRDDDKANPLSNNSEKTVYYKGTQIAQNVKINLQKLQIFPHHDLEKSDEQADLNNSQKT